MNTTTKNISHTYTTKGVFKVTLTAFNSTGCADTFTLADSVVIGPPLVKIANAPTQGCLPLEIKPKANVSGTGNIAKTEWNFGDGTIKTGKEPTHSYTKAGTYSIILLVTTNDGCTVSDTTKISVGDHSTLAFTATPRNVCAIDSVFFTNESQPSGISYNWYFGDETVHIDRNKSCLSL